METNGSQGPSPAPDFNDAVQQAQTSGDYDFVIETAKKSKKMLVDFHSAILSTQFSGREVASDAMGINFLENMIRQTENHLQMLRQTANAIKTAPKPDPEAA